jgi:hypothetical protein
MLIAWRDALALLKSLSEPTDAMLREGVLFLAAGPPQHLGLELEPHVIHDALLALEDAGYVQWTDWNHMSGTITGLRVTSKECKRLANGQRCTPSSRLRRCRSSSRILPTTQSTQKSKRSCDAPPAST